MYTIYFNSKFPMPYDSVRKENVFRIIVKHIRFGFLKFIETVFILKLYFFFVVIMYYMFSLFPLHKQDIFLLAKPNFESKLVVFKIVGITSVCFCFNLVYEPLKLF